MLWLTLLCAAGLSSEAHGADLGFPSVDADLLPDVPDGWPSETAPVPAADRPETTSVVSSLPVGGEGGNAAVTAPSPPSVLTEAAELELARKAAADLPGAIRTRDLPAVLIGTSILLLFASRALGRLGLAKTQRVEAVLMLCGGVIAAVAYLFWAEASALKETKATLLALTGGGSLGIAVAADRLGVGPVIAELINRLLNRGQG